MDYEEIDIVITDLVMQKIGGEAIVQAIAQDGFPVPVVVIAGYLSNETACSLLAMGAHDVLQKPISITEVQGVVDKWTEIAAWR